MDIYQKIRGWFRKMVQERGFGQEEIQIKAFPLTPQEAIGNPEEGDYPLLKGRERLMQAEFRGSVGQAYTDMYGEFSGPLSEVLEMELKNNYRRAIFISSLNAMARYLGVVGGTIHCKDADPPRCSHELLSHIQRKYGSPKVALVGMQPRMAEVLAKHFEIRITDLDGGNIGKERFGVLIEGPNRTGEDLAWCDLAVVTGTTVVNGTLSQFLIDKPVLFYGVTIAGVAKLMGLEHFCPLGR
ncbi:MAG: hypothetical protein JRI46_07065 [Deltaproteobacteria bacterium]|nr:hypothetical protein [Deltaproteobacteria bacterium]